MSAEGIRNFIESGGWYVTLIIVAGSIILAFLIRLIIVQLIRKVSKYSSYKKLYPITLRFRSSGTLFLILIILLFVFPFIKLPDGIDNIIKHIWTILLILDIAWILIGTVKTIKTLLFEKIDLEAKDNLRSRKISTQFIILQKILIAIIIVVAFSVALMTFDKIKEVGYSLLASAGIAGIIIGFAAQKSLTNVIAGLQIAITQPICIDDVVVVEGEWGKIEEITLTYIVVKIWDKRRMVLPITYFIENNFQNWTRSSSDILGTVYLYVDYKLPVDTIRKELTKILENTDLWDGQVNSVQVTGTNEKTMEVRALISSNDSSKLWSLRVLVREKLIEFLQKEYPECLPLTRINLGGKEENK